MLKGDLRQDKMQVGSITLSYAGRAVADRTCWKMRLNYCKGMVKSTKQGATF